MAARRVKRGEIWWLDWSPGRGSEQTGRRPGLVIQNDLGNEFAPTTIVAALTTRAGRAYPVLVAISSDESGLPRDSIVNLAQILTVTKRRLSRKAGELSEDRMAEVDEALAISLGLATVT
jgi:mRNA interferase MazF